MWRKSENILHRLSNREISSAAPNTHIHRARMLYENIVPNYTVYDVDCPDHHLRKFTQDGQYLICFSRNLQNLIIYRHNWLTYCSKGVTSDVNEELPPKGKNFESYFSQLYSLALTSGNEFICKDLFLVTDCHCYGIFATATTPVHDPPPIPGAVSGIPSMESITLHLVRLSDGIIVDQRRFHDDFIHLVHNIGIYMYDDFISVLSVRYQAIHILQVRKAGMFVDVRTVGPFCREDDELILKSHTQECSRASQGATRRCSNGGNTGVMGSLVDDQQMDFNHNKNTSPGLATSNHDVPTPSQEMSSHRGNLSDEMDEDPRRDNMLGGLKQRLLSYIFRSFESQDTDHAARAQRLKRFYYHFQHYVDLLMWKVQFLDRYHLLIKFGSLDGVGQQASHNSDASNQTAFYVIYNFESTEILGFHPNSSEELLMLFEQYYDHFRVVSAHPTYMRFISSYSNNKSAREQFQKQKAACNTTKPSGFAQVIRRTLATLPCNVQSVSPSVYFDQTLFHFDEKLISATDQYKPCSEHPIKFLSRRKPNVLKFKINPGLEVGAGDGRVKKVVTFIFHPVLPFVITVQQAFMLPAVVNFHMRR